MEYQDEHISKLYMLIVTLFSKTLHNKSRSSMILMKLKHRLSTHINAKYSILIFYLIANKASSTMNYFQRIIHVPFFITFFLFIGNFHSIHSLGYNMNLSVLKCYIGRIFLIQKVREINRQKMIGYFYRPMIFYDFWQPILLLYYLNNWNSMCNLRGWKSWFKNKVSPTLIIFEAYGSIWYCPGDFRL